MSVFELNTLIHFGVGGDWWGIGNKYFTYNGKDGEEVYTYNNKEDDEDVTYDKDDNEDVTYDKHDVDERSKAGPTLSQSRFPNILKIIFL